MSMFDFYVYLAFTFLLAYTSLKTEQIVSSCEQDIYVLYDALE